MPERTKGQYQIGCRVFDITEDIGGGNLYHMDIKDEYGRETTEINSGYREHWILLADLCLRLAERSVKFGIGEPPTVDYIPRIPRKEIRIARKVLRDLVSESKRSVEDNSELDIAKVGWLKED